MRELVQGRRLRMDRLSKYCHLVTVNSAGNCHSQADDLLEAFLQKHFTNQHDWTDQEIQSCLVHLLCRQESEDSDRQMAERSLLCFISRQIKLTCDHLELKYSKKFGLNVRKLYCFVLDSRNGCQAISNLSFAARILQSYDPLRSSLSNWVALQVKCHPMIESVLLEHGLFRRTDWAILNKTKSAEFQKIGHDYYQLASDKVQRSIHLLEIYHAVYYRDRINQQESNGIRPCQQPSVEQLQGMIRLLQDRGVSIGSPEQLLDELQQIAYFIRRYRTQRRQPIEQPLYQYNPDTGEEFLREDLLPQVTNRVEDLELEPEQQVCLAYRQQVRNSLDAALHNVVPKKIPNQRKNNPEKPRQFLLGLLWFHCKGKSMGEIATHLNRDQPTITRLLKLEELRADVRHQMIGILLEYTTELAKQFAGPEQLLTLDQQLKTFLNEDLDNLMQEAKKQAFTRQKRRSPCLFNQRMCHFLKTHWRTLRQIPKPLPENSRNTECIVCRTTLARDSSPTS